MGSIKGFSQEKKRGGEGAKPRKEGGKGTLNYLNKRESSSGGVKGESKNVGTLM